VLCAPQSVIGAKSDVPVLIVCQCLQLRGRLAAFASVCLAGLQLSARGNIVKAKGSSWGSVQTHQQNAHECQRLACVGDSTAKRDKAELVLHQRPGRCSFR
jgi:hypothetical protein